MVQESTLITPLADDAPLTLAWAFRAAKYADDGESTLRYWHGDFYAWSRGVYTKLSHDELVSQIWTFANGQRYRCAKNGKVLRYRPTSAKVQDVVNAIQAVTQVSDVAQMPAWLDTARPKTTDIIAFRNGHLHVPEFIEEGNLIPRPPTPLWFSTTVLPYQLERHTRCPKWLAFLNEVFDSDGQRVALLQEWMGYLLTGDTSQQKLLLLLGPPRSGKGTICRIVEQVIGAQNVVSPTLSDLGERFGLCSFLGKSVAIIADAHLVRETGSSRVVEVLKSITGEDAVRIDRKNREALPNTRITTRFLICANEMPQLPDASSALASRVMPLRMRNSYAGRENRQLTASLSKELSGIMLWALEGLAKLRTRGSFTVPEDSAELLREFEMLSSPVKEFLADCCILEGEVEMPVLYAKYRQWCDASGRKPLSRPMFGNKLRAALPRLEERRPNLGGKRARYYVGVSLSDACTVEEDLQRLSEMP